MPLPDPVKSADPVFADPMKRSPISLFACTSSLVFAFTNFLHANLLELNLTQNGSDHFHQYKPIDNGTAISFVGSIGGVYASGDGSVGYGHAYVHAFGYAAGSGAGNFQTGAGWNDDFTIIPTDSLLMGTPGTATFTFHLSGSATVTAGGDSRLGARYGITYYNSYGGYTLVNQAGNTDSGSGFPDPISNYSTFTLSVPFTFGSPVPLGVKISATASPSGRSVGGVGYPGSADINLQLNSGGLSVSAAGNSAVAYTMTSHTGTARGSEIASGGGFAGFTLTNTNPGSHFTQMSLLGGTTTSGAELNAAFSTASAGDNLASDRMSFSGTGTDKFVVQLSYDEAAAVTLFGTEDNAALLWRNPASQMWVNSVLGNSDGGAAQQHFLGAYDPNTEFVLGDYGVDTANNVVWAVIDHNSDFAVGSAQAAPEPGTCALMLMGMGAMLFRSRRNRV